MPAPSKKIPTLDEIEAQMFAEAAAAAVSRKAKPVPMSVEELEAQLAAASTSVPAPVPVDMTSALAQHKEATRIRKVSLTGVSK